MAVERAVDVPMASQAQINNEKVCLFRLSPVCLARILVAQAEGTPPVWLQV